MVRFFTVNIFTANDKILSFLRLTAKFLAVLRLTVNPIETLSQAWTKFLTDAIISPEDRKKDIFLFLTDALSCRPQQTSLAGKKG